MGKKNQKFIYIFEKEVIGIVLIVGVSILSVGIALAMFEGGLSSDNIFLLGLIIVFFGFLIKALYVWVHQRKEKKNDFFEALFVPRR